MSKEIKRKITAVKKDTGLISGTKKGNAEFKTGIGYGKQITDQVLKMSISNNDKYSYLFDMFRSNLFPSHSVVINYGVQYQLSYILHQLNPKIAKQNVPTTAQIKKVAEYTAYVLYNQ